MLPANNLFLDDSIEKRISIVSDDETINLTNADIHSEQFTLKESICSENTLKLGVESNSVEFTIDNTPPSMTGKWLTITLTPYNRNGTAGTAMALGRFKVFSDKPSGDRQTRTIIAYDKLFYVCKKNYKRWYRRVAFASSTTLTIKQFRDAFFEKIGITQKTATLSNDGVSIKKVKVPSKLTGKDILNAICEINGVFGHIARDGEFQYLTLSTSTAATSIAKTYTIKVEYEDNALAAVDRVEMLGKDGEIVASIGSAEDAYTNKYTIDNNFIINGMGGKPYYESALQAMRTNIATLSFVPLSAEMKGNPRYEVGDRITYNVGNTTKTSFIMNRTMTGVQALYDTYDSNTEEYYSNEPNAVNTKTAQMQSMEYQIGAMEDMTECHLEKLDDGTVIVRDEQLAGDEETGDLHTFTFYMWSQNDLITSGHTWVVYKVEIQCKNYNALICDMPYAVGYGSVRTADVGGKTYYESLINFVFKCPRDGEKPIIRERNTYVNGSNEQYSKQIGTKFVNLPVNWGEWSAWEQLSDMPTRVDDSDFYRRGHFVGSTYNGLYGMSYPDKHYSSNALFVAAFNAGEIIPPDLKNGDVILPTSTTQQQTVDNLVDLANEIAGTSGNSGTDTSTMRQTDTTTDVMSDDKQQIVANSIKQIKDGLSNWISGIVDNGRGKIVATIQHRNSEVADTYIHASTNLITSGDTVPTGAQPNDLHCEISDNSGIEMSMNSVNVGTYSMRVTRYGYDCKLTSGHTSGGEPTVFDQFIIAISGLTVGTQYTFSYKLSSATYDPTSNTYSNTTYNQATVSGVTKRYGKYGVMYSDTTSPDMTNVPTFGSENTWNGTLKWQNFPDLQLSGTSFSNTITATATTMYMVFKLEPIVTHNSPLVENFWVDELKEANMEIKFNTIKVYGEDNTWYEFEGGGSGGTTDYDNLDNKPSINSVTLSGNKTTRDLGMIEEITQAEYDLLSSAEKNNPDKVYYIKDAGGSGGGGGGSGTTVIANPSGEATDTLNKLQVGNTVYSVSGGSSGGYSYTTLWSGSQTTVGEVTLSDDVENYDVIEFICGFSGNNNDKGRGTFRYDAKRFTTDFPYTASPVNTSTPHFLINVYDNYFCRFIMGSASNKIYMWQFNTIKLYEIVGIKY